MFRREMGSKRGSLPPKEGDLTCMSWRTMLQTNSFFPFEASVLHHIKLSSNRTSVLHLAETYKIYLIHLCHHRVEHLIYIA